MNTPSTTHAPESVRTLLAALRRKIRTHVWLEGLAMAAIWMGVTFWLALALDFVPVLFWASEIPREVRMIALTLVALVLAWILYRWIVRRAWVRMSDSSMALLLERTHPQLRDALLTTVQLADRTGSQATWKPELLAATADEAGRQLGSIDVNRVLHRGPLIRKWLWAAAVGVPIAIFFVTRTEAFEIWMDRFYLLRDRPWPRSARIDVAGLRVRRRLPGQPQARFDQLQAFTNREIRVGRGAQLELQVDADTTAQAIPEYCTLLYRQEGGSRGRAVLNPLGRAEDNMRHFALHEKPLKGLQNSTRFDVIGLDHRVNGYRIEVVEAPLIEQTQLYCVYPAYLVDVASGSWTPRELPYVAGGSRLPQGTQVKIRITANKPLIKAVIYQAATQTIEEREPLGASEPDDRVIEFEAPRLDADQVYEIAILDTDQVWSEMPHQIALAAIQDTPPQADVQLVGIGALVTPQVVIPVQGVIRDDYRVASAWFDVSINRQQAARKVPLTLGSDERVNGQLDFRTESSGDPPLVLQPKDQLIVSVQAADAYDLGEAPNIGVGGQTELTVVTPDELLADLERKELAQRRRLEHVIEELTATRDSLLRVAQQLRGDSAGAEPGDVLPEPGDASTTDDQREQAERRARSLRALRVQQAQLQSKKSSQEVLGIGASLDLIVLELINNRVDSEDRQSRLRDQVATPLKLAAETLFPALDQRLEQLLTAVEPNETNAQVGDQTLAQADEILVRLNDVLEKMLDIETFNELVDIVRSLLEEHGQLADETKAERKKAALELLK